MKKSELRSIIRESIKNALIESYKKTKLTEARKLSSSDKKAIAKVVDDAELSFMRLSSSETWMDDYSTEDMVKILVTKYNSSEYRKTSLRDLLDAYDVKKQKDNIYGWKDEMSEGKSTTSKNLLSEKFESKSASKLYSKLKGTDSKFFQAFSNSYDVDWATAPEEAFGKGANPRLVNFFFVNKDIVNPFDNSRGGWEGTIRKGLIGVTRGKEKIHVNKGGYKTRGKDASAKGEKSKGRRDQGPMGSSVEGLHNYKRFAEVADEVITIDLTKIGTSTGKKADRAAAKKGATALISAKAMASQNRGRYEDLLKKRLADSSPGEQIIKMVDAVTKMYKQSVDKQLNMLKKKKVSSGWNDSASKIDRAFRDIMREFEYYLRAENSVIKGAATDKKNKLKAGDKDIWSEEKYYQKEMLKYARTIQKEFKELKSNLKKIDSSKDYMDLR